MSISSIREACRASRLERSFCFEQHLRRSELTHVVQSWIAKGANVDVLQCRRPSPTNIVGFVGLEPMVRGSHTRSPSPEYLVSGHLLAIKQLECMRYCLQSNSSSASTIIGPNAYAGDVGSFARRSSALASPFTN